MSFGKPKEFKPSTRKELKAYSRRAKEKEKTSAPKVKREDLEKRFRKQIIAKGSNKTLLRLLEGRPSKVIKANGETFLRRYFERLRFHKKLREKELARDPKKIQYASVQAPVMDLIQPGAFCYAVEGSWANFSWDDMSSMLIAAIGKGHRLPEYTTTAELTKRAMRQILGFVETKSGFSLASPKATAKLWEPLRKEIMSKKSKKLREQIEAIDEPKKLKKKKKRVEVVELEEEVPQKKAKKKDKLNGKRQKEESPRTKRATNLKDDNRLKPVGDHSYSRGMGEVWGLLPRKGILVADFFKAAKKKKMDELRTRQYLAIMRRQGSVSVL